MTTLGVSDGRQPKVPRIMIRLTVQQPERLQGAAGLVGVRGQFGKNGAMAVAE